MFFVNANRIFDDDVALPVMTVCDLPIHSGQRVPHSLPSLRILKSIRKEFDEDREKIAKVEHNRD